MKSISQMGKMYSGRLWIWKSYDTVDRHGMWQMLRVYGVGEKIDESSAEFLSICKGVCLSGK